MVTIMVTISCTIMVHVRRASANLGKPVADAPRRLDMANSHFFWVAAAEAIWVAACLLCQTPNAFGERGVNQGSTRRPRGGKARNEYLKIIENPSSRSRKLLTRACWATPESACWAIL